MTKLCGSMIGLMIAGTAITSVRAEETPLPSIVISRWNPQGIAVLAFQVPRIASWLGTQETLKGFA